MRQQYHSRPVGPDVHIWDVTKLVRAARDLPVREVPLSEIAELDEDWWYREGEALPTPRSLAHHMALVQATDGSHPIILCAQGHLMDGMHRVVKALLEGRASLPAVRLTETPPPDYVNVPLDELPYPKSDGD